MPGQEQLGGILINLFVLSHLADVFSSDHMLLCLYATSWFPRSATCSMRTWHPQLRNDVPNTGRYHKIHPTWAALNTFHILFTPTT
jgi:hypothetical protein